MEDQLIKPRLVWEREDLKQSVAMTSRTTLNQVEYCSSSHPSLKAKGAIFSMNLMLPCCHCPFAAKKNTLKDRMIFWHQL
jgi:hypothetical protein